jgi:DNA-binding beta-propeller fold protein YncE/predicted flap endonuclease-1-like 5' DNA nuclease
MKLVDRWDGAAAPFEGSRALRLLSLPAGALVRAATVRVEPAAARAAEPFVERLRLGGDGTGDWGTTMAAGAGWAEVDFHARRTLAGIAGTGLAGATLHADFGGGIFVPVTAAGAVAVAATPGPTFPASGDRFDLPGLTVTRFRVTRPDTARPDVREVRVRSVPANVSLRLGDTGAFWTRPGELAGPEASPDFGALLRAYLAEHPAQGGYHAVPLAVHADGMSRLRLTVEVDYLREAPLLPPDLPEVALPFGYGTVSPAGAGAGGAADGALGAGGTLTVSLLPGARVMQGAGPPPRVRGVFQDTRVVPGRGITGGIDPPHTARARVSAAFSQAQQVPAGEPAAVTGIDLCFLLSPGVAGARLQVDLRADQDGVPDPASLLPKPVPFAMAPGPDAARPVWVSVPLAAETHLARDTAYWIVVQALAGEAEWMGVKWDSPYAPRLALDGRGPAPGAATGPPLVSTADAGLSWKGAGPLTALFRLRGRPPAFRVPLELEVGDGPGALRVPFSRFDALGRVDFALDTPEVAATLTEAAGAASAGVGHEALVNGDFRAWVTSGSAPGRPGLVAGAEGMRPVAVAASPAGGRAYLLGLVDPSATGIVGFQTLDVDGIAEIDTATDRVVRGARLSGGGGSALLVSPDGARGYVLREAGSEWRVTVVDLATLRETGGARLPPPRGVTVSAPRPSAALSPDGGTLYLAGGTRIVAVDTARLDAAAGEAVQGVEAEAMPSRAEVITCLAASPDGTRLYAGGQAEGGAFVLFVLDAATLAEAAPRLALAEKPAEVVVAPDGSSVLVVPALLPGRTDTPLAMLEPARGRTSAVQAAGVTQGAVFAPDGGTAYLLGGGADTWRVAAYDRARRAFAETTQSTPGTGARMAITPAGDRLYLIARPAGDGGATACWAVPLGVRLPARWTATAPARLLTTDDGQAWTVLGDPEEPFASTPSLAQVAAVAPSTRYTFRFRGLATGGAEAGVFWLDGAGALVRREEAVALPAPEGERDDVRTLPSVVRAYTSPAGAAQVEVRFRVGDGAAAVAGVSLASTAGALADPTFRQVPGTEGSGWTVSPAIHAGVSLQAADGVFTVANRGQAAVEVAQAVELTGARTLELRVDGGADVLAPGAGAPRVTVRWSAADGTAREGEAAMELLPGDFEAHLLRLPVPGGAARAEVRLAVPPATGLRLRELSLRAAPEVAVPVRFVAEAPGELAVLGAGIVYDVGEAAAPRAPAAGLAAPAPPDRTPGRPPEDDCAPEKPKQPPAVPVAPGVSTAVAVPWLGRPHTLFISRTKATGIARVPDAAGAAAQPVPPPAPAEGTVTASAVPLTPGAIAGIGSGRIRRLAEAGIGTVPALAAASVDDVAERLDVSTEAAREFIADARRLAGSSGAA